MEGTWVDVPGEKSNKHDELVQIPARTEATTVSMSTIQELKTFFSYFT